MATAEDTTDVAINSDAMDVMDCFSNGMDGVVYSMAAHIATARGASEDGIVITVNDIEQAVSQVVNIMKNSDLSEDIKDSIASMLDCCSHRISQQK